MTNQLKTILLLGTLTALVVAFGALVAPGRLYLFAAIALAMNLGAYFFSDRVVLRLHHAREVNPHDAPELHAIVDELALRAQLPKPRVYVIPDEQPNAFATGRSPARGVVAVTEGLLQLLDRREVRGVLAHELAHIKSRDILVASLAAAGAATITSLAHALSFGSLFGSARDEGEGDAAATAGGLLAALVAPFAATLVQLGISRSREYLADEAGARISDDPEALATALVKLEQASKRVPAHGTPATASLFIVNPFAAGESLARWFSTHPSTEERVRRLRAIATRARATRGPAQGRTTLVRGR
jgi:heat shock protein HtpX